jgi:CheY-like chemotaxis protein
MPLASTLRVLCVDDQESMLSLHKFAFAQLGIREVTLVSSVRDAELMLKNGRFDLVVTDWNMPDIDGLTFFKRLKQDPDHKDIPVIMVTGNADIEHVKTAMAAGLRFFLRKPVKPADLKLRVEAAVGKLA